MRRTGTPIVALIVILIAGCTSTAGPSEVQLGWKSVAAPDSRAIVHDVKACDGALVAAGAIQVGADPSTAPNEQIAPSYRPAIWRWEGGGWTEVPVVPIPENYYGQRAILRSMTCTNGKIAAVGAASGGAHGNPRVTTWLGPAAGPIVQNPDPYFEMFMGSDAIGVGDITGFGSGFVITGNFLNAQGLPSATIWPSSDGVTWERLSNVDGLTSTPQIARRAVTIIEADGKLYLLGDERVGLKVTPWAVTSADGKGWTRVPVAGEGSAQWTDGSRFLVLNGSTVAWRGQEEETAFTLDSGTGTQPPSVTGATMIGNGTVVGACGSAGCGAWLLPGDATQWQAIAMPAPLKATPNSAVLLASVGNRLLMVLTEGKTVQVFETTVT